MCQLLDTFKEQTVVNAVHHTNGSEAQSNIFRRGLIRYTSHVTMYMIIIGGGCYKYLPSFQILWQCSEIRWP